MKRISALLLTVLILCACGKNGDSPAEGTYTGFADIPTDYCAEEAIRDGCLVIDTVYAGTNEYGAELHDTKTTAGSEHWQAFLKASERGEDARLRVAHFIDGVGYYKDLCYRDGRYTLYSMDERGITAERSFTHLRRLDGFSGPPGERKEDCFYVLTDSMDLTYEEVKWAYISSNMSSVTDIPFVWLTFTVYFS